jgi:shikimate kinase
MINIVLIGPMGSGKTTVGRALASKIGVDFFDSDEVLMAQENCSMTTLITKIGEPAFRVRETAVVQLLLQRQPIVLATGGGVVLKVENRQQLKQHAVVIYLSVKLSTQLNRLAEEDDRPLLKVPDRREKLAQLNAKRLPYYEKISDITLPVDGLAVEDILERIINILPTVHSKTTQQSVT